VEGAHPTVSDTPNADNIVPNVCHGGSGTHPIVSEVQSGIANPHTAASDIYRDELKRRQGVGSQNQAVSVTHSLIIIWWPLTTAYTHARSAVSNYNLIQCSRPSFGAPGELPPPPPKNVHRTIDNIRRDVSEVHRDVVDIQTAVHDIHNMLKIQEGASGQPLPVSITRNLSPVEHTLTVA